jgi:hypothetical protein
MIDRIMNHTVHKSGRRHYRTYLVKWVGDFAPTEEPEDLLCSTLGGYLAILRYYEQILQDPPPAVLKRSEKDYPPLPA